jgi:hypothetical protein
MTVSAVRKYDQKHGKFIKKINLLNNIIRRLLSITCSGEQGPSLRSQWREEYHPGAARHPLLFQCVDNQDPSVHFRCYSDNSLTGTTARRPLSR